MLFDEYKLKPDECIFVTDTLGDLLEAKELNIGTIAVTWGYHEEERLKFGHPDIIINNFDELIPSIEKFGNPKSTS